MNISSATILIQAHKSNIKGDLNRSSTLLRLRIAITDKSLTWSSRDDNGLTYESVARQTGWRDSDSRLWFAKFISRQRESGGWKGPCQDFNERFELSRNLSWHKAAAKFYDGRATKGTWASLLRGPR